MASMGVFFIVQQIDTRLSLSKECSPSFGFATRSAMTLIASQLLDTILLASQAYMAL